MNLKSLSNETLNSNLGSLSNETLNSNLRSLSNKALNSSLKSLVHQERELLSDILNHIAEVDRRKLYLKMSYPNLFEYLTHHLGYSNGSAQRRLEAARLLIDVPTLAEKLKSGELNLTQVAFMQKCIRQKKKESKTLISKEQKQSLIEELMGKSQEDSQRIVSQNLDLEIKQASKVCQQKDESVRLEVTLSKAQWEKLNQMRELLSTSLPIGSWDEVLEYVSDKVIAQKTQSKPRASMSKKAQKSKPRTGVNQNAGPSKPTNFQELKGSGSEMHPKKSKDSFVSASTKKFILNRDRCCQHIDSQSKKQCASKWNLQVDHIQPVWAGGNSEIENLRVLCAAHNQQRYKEQAGIR